MAERKAVTKHLARSHRAGDRIRKGRILHKIVEVTGWHRDHARAVLRDPLDPPGPRVRPGRAPVYGADLQPALVLCRAVLRAPAGKFLAAMRPELVPMPSDSHLRSSSARDPGCSKPTMEFESDSEMRPAPHFESTLMSSQSLYLATILL